MCLVRLPNIWGIGPSIGTCPKIWDRPFRKLPHDIRVNPEGHSLELENDGRRTHEHELHYRCTFELSSTKPSEQTWVEIARLVPLWIASKFPANQASAALDGKWFRLGGEWRPPKYPRAVIKTEACVGDGSELAPQWWAIALEHSDAQINVRHWRTDLALTRKDDKRIVFSISVIHWLSAGYIGQKPADPLPSAPRIVLDVLRKQSCLQVHLEAPRG